MAKSKIARIRDRASNLRKRTQATTARGIIGGSSWVAGTVTGGMMAKDQKENKRDHWEVRGRKLPKYETMGLVGVGLGVAFGGKMSPELGALVLGTSAGVAAGAGGVRSYQKELAKAEEEET